MFLMKYNIYSLIEMNIELTTAVQIASRMAKNASRYAQNITHDDKLPLTYEKNEITLTKIYGRNRTYIKFNNGFIYWYS